MKSILIHLNDDEWHELDQARGDLTWREVILTFLEVKALRELLADTLGVKTGEVEKRDGKE